jgi:hypothetical protein
MVKFLFLETRNAQTGLANDRSSDRAWRSHVRETQLEKQKRGEMGDRIRMFDIKKTPGRPKADASKTPSRERATKQRSKPKASNRLGRCLVPRHPYAEQIASKTSMAISRVDMLLKSRRSPPIRGDNLTDAIQRSSAKLQSPCLVRSYALLTAAWNRSTLDA